MYRNSIPWLLGLKENASKELVNSLVQYDYEVMRAVAVDTYKRKRKWLAYLMYNIFPNNPELEKKIKFPYSRLDMGFVPVKMVQCYNMLTTNNKCNECSTKEARIRLSISHIQSRHNIDIEELMRKALMDARNWYNILQNQKKTLDLSVYSQRCMLRKYKKFIFKKCKESINNWNLIHSKIVRLI